MERLRRDGTPARGRFVPGVVVACALAVAVGCGGPRPRETRVTLVLHPDASCAGSTAVDVVDRLRVTLFSDAGDTLDSWELAFDVGGTATSLGDVPRDGRVRFEAHGLGPVCGAAAPIEVFGGSSPLVTLDPEGDQRVDVEVSCPPLDPCDAPEPEPGAFATGQAADLVLGQRDFTTCDGGGLDASRRFREPDGLEIASGVLWVADPGFNRIAAFADPAQLGSGAELSFAVGQESRTDNGDGDDENSFRAPRDLAVLDDGLVLVDSGNHRAAVITPIPDADGGTASSVIGQDNTDNQAPNAGGSADADTLRAPSSALRVGDHLFVADPGNHRVLRFLLSDLAANRPAADLVLGQADFTGDEANRGGPAADDTLSAPTHVATDGVRLWVADSGNARVLAYDLATLATGAPASFVLDAAAGVAFVEPRGVAASAERLAIADSGNHRVLVWEPPPAAPSVPPTAVLGQPDPAGTEANAGGDSGNCPALDTCGPAPGREPTSASLSRPGAVLLDGDALWVSDTCNSRVLRYRAAGR